MAFTIISRNIYNSNKRILFNHNLCRIISSVNLSSVQKPNRKTKETFAATYFVSKLRLIQGLKLDFGRQLVSSFFNIVGEFSHMDDVRKAQSKVIEIKENLRKSGDKKRLILLELDLIRNDIQKNHYELCNTNRGTERFLALVQDEMKLLKNKEKKHIECNHIDKQERQNFNNLTAAINDSYEKEKIHSNFIKLIGFLCTLAASILTLIASLVGYYYHSTKFQSEISNLRSSLKLDFANAMNKKNPESWGTYFKRHGSNIYYYINPESWGTYFKRHGSNIYNFIMRKPSS